MQNRVTQLLGCRYPIVQGGLTRVGVAELAAAVSNAGAFGMLTALTQPTPDALRTEIARCREMTNQPFGVNLTILPTTGSPPYAEYLDAAIEGRVAALETAGANPETYIEKARASGLKVIHKCCSVRHALKAEQMGVDIISIDGFECAGHPGDNDTGGLILIPATTAQVNTPVIASGGIGDGRGMAAALALGAQGINMGTRFVVTQEAPVHANIKQAYVDADERQTQVIFRSLHNTARVYRNAVAAQVVDKEAAGCSFADIQHLVSGERGRVALETGEVDAGLLWAGQIVGLINDVPTCHDLIERIMAECRHSLARSCTLLD